MFNIRRATAFALAATFFATLFLGTGCVRVTRTAVQNDTQKAITVKLQADGEGEVVEYAQIPPGATTDFSELPFDEEDLGRVSIVVDGETSSQSLGLNYTEDNTIVISSDAPPAVQSKENPDNKFW